VNFVYQFYVDLLIMPEAPVLNRCQCSIKRVRSTSVYYVKWNE